MDEEMIDLIWSEQIAFENAENPEPERFATQEEQDELTKSVYLDTLQSEQNKNFKNSKES